MSDNASEDLTTRRVRLDTRVRGAFLPRKKLPLHGAGLTRRVGEKLCDPVAISLTEETFERVREIALREGVSFAAVARRLIDRGLSLEG